MPTIAACPLKVITAPPCYGSVKQHPPRQTGGATSRAQHLTPVVNRDGLLVIAAHDAPVAIRLAAHHHHVDGLGTEYRNQLIWRRLELRGPGLLAKGRPWVEIVLDQLIVPVLTGR